MSVVRTRFAPSPTGYLHIGGVRTALFCYLFAKKHAEGRFVLRIDDTDQQRNVQEALAPILSGLKWLGINWDEGPEVNGPFAPYYQSQRADKYQAAVDKLLADGFAYRDYSRPEELQAEREEAQAAKRTFVYSRRFMAETEEDCRRFEAEGRQGVVRLKIPREGSVVVHDLIRGDVEFDWAQEQDHVIQRADGSCLYHLANVVDDYDLQITHVIRAEEHLSNTPRQIFIAQSLGYPLPQYAHLPFVAEPGSKTKLSKRKLDKYLKNRDFAKLVEQGKKIADRVGLATTADGFNPVIVDFYRQVGYLPEAIDNYIALLGWALDDKSEYFSLKELLDLFTLEGVTKASASFDPAKLFAFQEKHMAELPAAEKYARVLRYLIAAKYVEAPEYADATFEALPELAPAETVVRLPWTDALSPEAVKTTIEKTVAAAGDRIKVSGDVLDFDEFFADDANFPIDEKAWNKRIVDDADAVGRLADFLAELEAIPEAEFVASTLDAALHAFLEKRELKPAQLIHALRVASTGKGVGVGMFDALEILGKDRATKRIRRALELARQ